MLKRILNATIFAILAPKHAFSTQPNFQSSHDGRCTVSYMVGLIKKSGLWDASKPCFGMFLAYGAHFGPRWYLQLWFLNFCETRANRSDPVICSRIALLPRKSDISSTHSTVQGHAKIQFQESEPHQQIHGPPRGPTTRLPLGAHSGQQELAIYIYIHKYVAKKKNAVQ